MAKNSLLEYLHGEQVYEREGAFEDKLEGELRDADLEERRKKLRAGKLKQGVVQ